MQEVDALALNYFLYQFIYGGSMLFPEELGDDELKNLAGSSLNINPAALNEKRCVLMVLSMVWMKLRNLAHLLPLSDLCFNIKSARSFLYALLGSSLFSSYVSDLSKYIVLVPTAEQFEASGILTVYSTQGWKQKEMMDGRKSAILPSKISCICIQLVSRVNNQVNYQKEERV